VVLDAVDHHRGPVDPAELQDETELSQTKLTTAVSRLEEAGAVEVLPSGEVAQADHAPEHAEAIRAAAEAEEKRRSFDRSRVDMMRGYAETQGCRRAHVLSYFGEPFEPPCGHCDNCEAGHGVPETAGDEPFAVGARVAHGQWGEGVVQRYDDVAVIVLFDEVGYKSLALDVVAERGILTAV
jgi:ATP-dependent DNA helicase RecQ